MSKPRFPKGTFCRVHPNYSGTREPIGNCTICNFLWTMFGQKNAPRKPSMMVQAPGKEAEIHEITEADYIPSVEDREGSVEG
jgi:hypothetical protein